MKVLSRTRRSFNFVGFLICAGLLGYAFFLQFHDGLQPCPLCVFQRIGMLALGAVFLLAGIFSFRGRGTRIWAILLGLIAAAGAATSARHLWVQAHPEAVGSCGPSLKYMWDMMPVWNFIKRVLTGTGDCAIVHWTFLDLSMPGWVLICFVCLGVFGVWANWLRLR